MSALPTRRRKRLFLAAPIVCSKSIRNADGAHYADNAHRFFRAASARNGGVRRESTVLKTTFSLDADAIGGNV
jgi:hypothetical protein